MLLLLPLYPAPCLLASVQVQLLASEELHWDWTAGSCVCTAAASPCLSSSLQLEVAQPWLSSTPAGSCPHAATEEQGTGRSSGHLVLTSNCLTLAQLLTAKLQPRHRQRQSLPALHARSNDWPPPGLERLIPSPLSPNDSLTLPCRVCQF